MIENFDDKALEAFYYHGASRKTRRIPTALHSVLRRKLDMLNSAHRLDDLKAPPANRLESLKGDLEGYKSIRVNDQWRIVFRWTGNSAVDISLMDYH